MVKYQPRHQKAVNKKAAMIKGAIDIATWTAQSILNAIISYLVALVLIKVFGIV